jgi:hypothetical protein
MLSCPALAFTYWPIQRRQSLTRLRRCSDFYLWDIRWAYPLNLTNPTEWASCVSPHPEHWDLADVPSFNRSSIHPDRDQIHCLGTRARPYINKGDTKIRPIMNEISTRTTRDSWTVKPLNPDQCRLATNAPVTPAVTPVRPHWVPPLRTAWAMIFFLGSGEDLLMVTNLIGPHLEINPTGSGTPWQTW